MSNYFDLLLLLQTTGNSLCKLVKFMIMIMIISLRRVLSTVRPSCVTNTLPSDRGQLVTLVGGVCVPHSSETRVTVLLWPFVADDLLLGDR